MAIARVQTAEFVGTTGDPIATNAIATTSGNFLLVFLRNGSGSNGTPIVSVTDTAGNTFTQLVNNTVHDPNMTIYYAKNITGNASNVVTINMTGNVNYAWIKVIEYSGVHLTSPIDISGANPASATTDCVSTSITTAAGGEMLVMAVSGNSFTTYSAGTDFTLIDGSIGLGAGSDFGGVEEYLTASALSSYTAHITSASSLQYTTAWVALIPAPAAATGNFFLVF